MFRHDTVRSAFSEFARESDMSRKSPSWYRRTNETIVVVTLTRAPYGHQYFLTVGVVLRTLDADENPRERHCHIRTRFDRLVPAAIEHRVNDLFDVRFLISAAQRRVELLALLRSELLPLFERAATLDGLRSVPARDLLRASTITDDARQVLAMTP